MSYLDPPRLHFAGKFAATISTVNNDPTHFDNATFKPEYQERGPGTTKGWFNPRGDGDWRLMGCKVTSAVAADGKPVAGDPVLDYLVADSDRLPPAKLVDLDPEQQLVSTIWGLEMRICDAAGENLVRGSFEPAAFMDIWYRAIGGGSGGDMGAAAMYQSVLTDLEWWDVSASPFLTALKAAATGGRLSVKFNVDGINMNFKDPDFMRGRLVGTIGVAAAEEPKHFVRGRQFMSAAVNVPPFPVPGGGVNNCVASVDAPNEMIHLDLGNALPTTVPGGPIADMGELQLTYGGPPIGTVENLAADWYETTAGVVSFPLSAAALQGLTGSQLSIMKPAPGVPGETTVAIAEPANGLHCRADQFVYRLDAGQTATVEVWASQFGQPYANAQIQTIRDAGQLQGYPGAPDFAVPPEAIDFPETVVTGANGVATLPIFSRDPGNPRGYLDGQIYGVRPMLAETVAPGDAYPFNIWEFISLYVFDVFEPDEPPTWLGSLQPIFQQYANLYPLMADILNLADYESVCGMREMLILAFEQPVTSPNSMPATRDLSLAKRRAILRWLRNLGPDGKSLLGPLVPPATTAPPVRAVAAGAEAEGGDPAAAVDPGRGGKAEAAARRQSVSPNARRVVR